MNYKKIGETYYIRADKGDEIIGTILKICQQEQDFGILNNNKEKARLRRAFSLLLFIISPHRRQNNEQLVLCYNLGRLGRLKLYHNIKLFQNPILHIFSLSFSFVQSSISSL